MACNDSTLNVPSGKDLLIPIYFNGVCRLQVDKNLFGGDASSPFLEGATVHGNGDMAQALQLRQERCSVLL